jgi:NAD(P)-dependent dehydrogenase (short-subunit alcohol dehydrogenase family)
MSKFCDLNGKTVLVAGAAGLLGKSILAGTLEAGANVVALDSNEEKLQELGQTYPHEARLMTSVVDISDAQALSFVFESVSERFGGIDGAVNTAYPRGANYGKSFLDVEYADFCESLSLHLGCYFLFMQQCAKYSMIRQRKFSLVNLSSIYGVMAPRFSVYEGTSMTMPVEYAAIKAGLIHLTRYVNVFMKGGFFRANCISPGGILAGQDPQFLSHYNAHCLSKGMLDAKDIIGSVIHLLSDASEYVAGQNIIIDDGFSL